MSIKRPVAAEKKGRKTADNAHPPLRLVAAREAVVSPAEIGVSRERRAAFDPRLLLTKLAGGKTNREYLDKQAIFSQGDAAGAVFYIQSGKVKLPERLL
jgi:hypothetical protein